MTTIITIVGSEFVGTLLVVVVVVVVVVFVVVNSEFVGTLVVVGVVGVVGGVGGVGGAGGVGVGRWFLPICLIVTDLQKTSFQSPKRRFL
jgi:hypothetical protein